MKKEAAGAHMRLTRYTDYSIRVLVYLAAHPERRASIGDISRAYSISQNHLMKVVHELGKAGYVTTVRGRAGGIRLARPASEITVGQVVRSMEGGFDLVDCSSCAIARGCGMTRVLKEAVMAFLAVLDSYTFADIPQQGMDIAAMLRAFQVPVVPVPEPCAATLEPDA
ncbi:Rrf2 family transcriptional regulator [Terrihabitans sp. PJ23]|uniref:Rrf2 family transcriptional regulator n=2 Tax=Terrihabitans rhizophilus TaxID=3092662 RepID=A0ABU4RNI6_9HYPH|nr:Rrf2 family transcriptional regulator [Terrihabitans sp. PJ23]MDX6805743.1 Rrf2 family transcriptional regulator [Terrihabitans sp. PJ23]